jgi:hypothetical protein
MNELRNIIAKIECTNEDKNKAYNALCDLFGVSNRDLKIGDEIYTEYTDGSGVCSEAVVVSNAIIQPILYEVEYKHNGVVDEITTAIWKVK